MRLVAHATALVVGAGVGLATVGVHRSAPGLLLASVTTVAVLFALRQWHRRLVTSYALGWLVPVTGAVLGRAEGDFAVTTDASGWLLILLGFAVLTAGAVSASARDSGS